MSRGLLTIEYLAKLVEKEEIETVIVGFIDHIGRVMGTRFDAYFLNNKI